MSAGAVSRDWGVVTATDARGPAAGPGPSRRRRGLSLDRVVDAALNLIDERGMAAASMRAVAARLEVEPMSLYHYVANRDRLFDAIVERVVEELTDDPDVHLEPTDGWRQYLESMARGVRRYARGHPHAFPVVATRPPEAPWINPPLRSLRWIEAFLSGLRGEGFSDGQVLFAYRTFNGFLLGFLLLETGAMTVQDPKPGDGAFAGRSGDGAADPSSAVPGGLSPTRTSEQRHAVREATTPAQMIDPLDAVDADLYPTVHDLAVGLSEDHFDAEFEAGLQAMLDRIGLVLTV